MTVTTFLVQFPYHMQFDPFAGSVWSHTDLIRLREGGVGAQVRYTYILSMIISYFPHSIFVACMEAHISLYGEMRLRMEVVVEEEADMSG